MFYPENTVKKVGTCKHQVNKYVLISLWKLLFSEKIFTNAWKEKCCTVVLTIVDCRQYKSTYILYLYRYRSMKKILCNLYHFSKEKGDKW